MASSAVPSLEALLASLKTELPSLPAISMPVADASGTGLLPGQPSAPGGSVGVGVGTTGTPTTTTGPVLSATGVLCNSNPLFAGVCALFGVGTTTTLSNQLVRLVLLLLGIICVIGAIYLFKSTSIIVQAPLRAAHKAVKGAIETAAVVE